MLERFEKLLAEIHGLRAYTVEVVRRRDEYRARLEALVLAADAAEGAYDALDGLVCESSKSIHDSTMWEAEESLGWQRHRNEWYPKMAALKTALLAARDAL